MCRRKSLPHEALDYVGGYCMVLDLTGGNLGHSIASTEQSQCEGSVMISARVRVMCGAFRPGIRGFESMKHHVCRRFAPSAHNG